MIYFVGAGPGDPELITVKGAKALSQAQVVIYAGSLVNPALLDMCAKGTEIHNSAGMNLDEITGVMVEAYRAAKEVVRLHTGDPSLYGAIQEQMDILDQEAVPYKVIPGVSSFLAAAAAIPHELTLPGFTQTVILTRMEGRTPVPERESIRSLATHRATMCIFLSVHMLDKLAAELIAGGYPDQTPAAVVEKASWPGERALVGTLANIAVKAHEAGITRTAMIIVGEALSAGYRPSYLYDANFAHMYRGDGD
ncbi:MAG: cobalt-precorrin-4 C(11)-methyltransferase [Peptococcaceae bacterium BRH_c8a]|nr:MAG: cobalt-precorrin-4 C(11)-methyltransferase [Peptococcaceae bacterium BRH_c8a]